MPRVPSKIALLKSQSSKTWSSLTNAQLHRTAVLIGTPCSGTKPTRIEGIEKALAERSVLSQLRQSKTRLSLVSIDMGIRNLAYAHFSAAALDPVDGTEPYSKFAELRLEAWERLSISPTPANGRQNSKKSLPSKETSGDARNNIAMIKLPKESFEPKEYATHAYNFIHKILSTHRPTHILIERQRFRSGGGSAVQEWTIRVGVFEGMLYAVLKTIAEERGRPITVQGILPTKVNRYWFEEGPPDGADKSTRKLSGKEVKNAKIDIVGSMLATAKKTPRFEISAEAQAMADDFASKLNGASQKPRAKTSSNLVKLDDVADCMLQGLAWIEWQNNIERAKALGVDAFNLSDG